MDTCIIFLFLGSAASLSIHKQDVIVYNENCFLDEINFLSPSNCTEVEGALVRHLGRCLVQHETTKNSNIDGYEVLNCIHGHWSGTKSSHAVLHREKRWLVFVIGGLVGLAAVGCALFCRSGGGGGGGGTTGITKYPPSFQEPCKPNDLQDNYNVGAVETSVVVGWTVPTASDRDGGPPNVTQVNGGENGGHFNGSTYGETHYITYKATDDDGLTEHCYFSFTVKTLTCDVLAWPQNGAISCDNNNILGSSCQFTCISGYQLTGSSTVVCENETAPTWSPVPSCEKIACDTPTSPEHSSVHCTDSSYSYQSVCSIICDEGFFLEGTSYLQCKADGTWSNIGSSSTCKDGTPPTITCITPQIFYADRDVTSKAVNWQLPTAIDETDDNPTIEQTEGLALGSVLEVGSTIVKYKAVDVDGNESPECFIELRVDEITCGHPLDSFIDNYLIFNCSTARYVYGTSCTLSCSANLPLKGTDLVTCEVDGQSKGNWSWGSGEKPYCREISCPELDPPINGALVYDTVRTRPAYTMLCNGEFDIPDMGANFNGIFLCTDDGHWNPFTPAPDCIEPKNPRFLNLPAEIFYYSGECGSKETMNRIEQQFQQILDQGLNPYFNAICPDGERCLAENIVITCGPIQSRKKRSLSWYHPNVDLRQQKSYIAETRREHNIQKRQSETHLLVLEFYIVVVFKLEVNETVQGIISKYDDIQLNILKPAVQEMINNGTFDIEDFVLKTDSFKTPSYGDIKCEPGYMLDRTTCKPCPLGYSLNETTSKCDMCPVGQYKDNESDSTCTVCPTGYSTKETGSKSTTDCIKLCSPGSYSPDTLESCSPCRQGYYQDEYGQTTCKSCPSGTITESTNSASVNDCINYDIFLETTNGGVTISTIPGTLSSVTFMFWSKRLDERDANVALRLTSDGTSLINVYLTEDIRVEIPSRIDETVGHHSSSSWNHVTITWDTVNSRVNVFLDGVSVYTKDSVSAPSTPLVENGAFLLTSSSQTGVYLTGLHLLRNVLTLSDIANHASTCHLTENNDVIDTGAFTGSEQDGISIVPASSCYSNASDACLSSPCNGHVCTNGHNGFTCTCHGGWSGTTCTIQPDFCIGNACKNSATCVSGQTNYTCTCSTGYSGTFCEVAPVNGGLSDWGVWSGCSQSCGSGTKTRTRACDSPSPDAYGADCVGDRTETSSCNVEACQVCPDLERKYGTLLNCTTDQMTGIETCLLYCEQDKLLPPGLSDYQTYTCGPSTNYAWDSLDNPPSCVEPVGPGNVNITVNVDYTSVIEETVVTEVENIIDGQISAAPCFNSPNCQPTIAIIQSTLAITFNIPLHLGPDIQYGDYISSGTASGALQELIDAISFLESTAQYIQNNTNELFEVTVNDVTYSPNINGLTFGAGVTCNSGFVALDGVCVACPSGTYSSNGVCIFCERGTYQVNSGQTECLKCPDGYTTSTIGSPDSSQCTEILEVMDGSTTERPPNEDKSTVYIAVALSVAALLVALLALGIVWYIKIRPKKRVDERDPHIQIKNTKFQISYRRDVNTSDTSKSEADDVDNISDNDTSPRYVREPSVISGYLTPAGITVECSSPPPAYDSTDLPPYTEDDPNRISNIYNTIDDK